MAKDKNATFTDVSEDDLKSLMEIFKSLSLTISSFISSEFKLKFLLSYTEHECKQFQDISFKEDPAVYNELKWFSKPALLYADRSFISRLANRILGGDGVAETTENPDSWFFSEECVATEFVDLILDYLKTHNQLIKFEKSVKDVEYLHIYYPEDVLLSVNFKIEFDGEEGGSMGILMGESVLKEYIKVPEESSISEEGSDSSNADTTTKE
ncbi:MAG: hypothetical protein CMP21_03190 [Rickettsiales bacterium]|nr:hypothetical protein [Rickettsiales bacterium]